MRDPAIQSNRMQCLFALISASIVAVCVCVGVTMNLVTLYDENFDHMGIRTFCMFTVDSNILAGLSMLLCLPYTVDGLHTGYYHLPDWVVVLMHIAVTAVSLTFLVSLFILAPVKGFALIFSGSRFFLHGVCPVLCIVAFCCFINSHLIRLRESLLALVPVLIYAVVYLVMVVFIGEDRGGWNDFYGFLTRAPEWISLSAFLPLTYGIAFVLRVLHNGSRERYRNKASKSFFEAYNAKDMREVIMHMAATNSRIDRTGDIVIPYRALRALLSSAEDEESFEEYCILYMRECLKQEIAQE